MRRIDYVVGSTNERLTRQRTEILLSPIPLFLRNALLLFRPLSLLGFTCQSQLYPRSRLGLTRQPARGRRGRPGLPLVVAPSPREKLRPAESLLQKPIRTVIRSRIGPLA